MPQLTTLGAALMMLVVGALHLFAPQMMMKDPGIELTTVNHLHVVRAVCGGAYMGMGVLFLLGTLRLEYRRFSLLAIAVLFGGFAAGRLFSVAVDGWPVPLYLAVLGAELSFATLAVASLRRVGG
jgi:hypothetical protein